MCVVPRAVLCPIACLLALLIVSSPGIAQTITTGTLSGVVTDQQGGVLPGASVTAVHTPTGTRYEVVTGGEGRFVILNARVGGPYQVTVRLQGFRERTVSDVQVSLGEEQTVDFSLQLETVTERVDVVAETSPIDPGRAGTASNVPTAALEALPTIARSLDDFARTSPYFSQTGLNDDPLALSVAGRNNRYNNVQIDGAVNNDLFGLAASGAPGGQTEAQPISLDAIQELQLVVSPYDVRQGGFSGGGVNAITRSGSNELRGTGYYFGRNNDLVGDGPDDRPFGRFSDHQFGVSAGGPIRRNRAFYFGNLDVGRRDTPSGFSIEDSGQRFGHRPEAERFASILKNKYGYDPGGTEEFIRTTNNNKAFVRADFNLRTGHRLIARHNFIDAENDIGRPDLLLYYFPDNFYRIRNRTNSTVVQVNSTLGRAFNELRFTFQRVRDRRASQPGSGTFPFVRVDLGDGTSLRAGTENFSTANELDQDIVELTDDFTILRGAHTLTFGTHNELFEFRNLFIRDNFGNYRFSSLDLFEAGFAQAYDHSFSATNDPRQAAKFGVRQLGFYAGDQWRASNRLTITYGVRLDLPFFPDKPTRNPVSEELFGYRTDVVPESVLWSPRIGFNWDVTGEGRAQVRGGVGLFSGRTPYVWLSNQYGNTGIEFTRLNLPLSSLNRVPFVPDPAGQPRTVGRAATNEIDVVDPHYQYPQLVRGNLAYDKELGWGGLIATVELLASRNVNDVKYQNLNLELAGGRPDGRPVYRRRIATLSDVIFLSNTDQGHQWSTVLKLERPWRDGWNLSGSYLYGQARSISDSNRSQAVSNWGSTYVPGDPNNPPLTRSNFDPGHRITVTGSYDVRMPRSIVVTLSAFFNAQSGRPYSLSYNGDYNGDNQFFNDQLYIPRSASEVIVSGGTFELLDAFIDSEECLAAYKGQIHERNACRAPWTNQLDFRAAIGVPLGRRKVEFTVDVFNLWNVVDKDAGLLEFANFNQNTAIRFRGMDAATGLPIYDVATLASPTFQKFVREDLRSRWQAQFGARFRF